MALPGFALTSAFAMMCLAVPVSAQTNRGKALVIGLSAYQHLPPLTDSTSQVSDGFSRLGFTTTLVRNVQIAGLRTAIQTFASKLQEGEIAVVYCAGYALQSNGDNYLAPIGFDVQNPAPVTQQGYSLSLLTENLEARRPGLMIILLDTAWSATELQRKASGVGLSGDFERRNQLFLLLSNAPDRDGIPGSPASPSAFSNAVVEMLKKPGLTLSGVYEGLKSKVMAATNIRLVPTMVDFVTRTEPFILVPAPELPVTITDTKVPIVTPPVVVAPGTAKENPRDLSAYVWIPPGEFKMGCVPNDKDCSSDETPQRKITIEAGFWMTQTEVTVFAYDRFSRATSRKMPTAPLWNKKWKLTDRPITEVSWTDAEAFCAWIGGRLPTEAEWEYAARAGADDKIFVSGDSLTHDDANYLGSGGKDRWVDPGPVRSFDANAWKLYDLSGNVREWTLDWYSAASGQRLERVIRGGSYNDGEKQLRLSMRAHRKPELWDNQTGFRCAVPAIPAK